MSSVNIETVASGELDLDITCPHCGIPSKGLLPTAPPPEDSEWLLGEGSTCLCIRCKNLVVLRDGHLVKATDEQLLAFQTGEHYDDIMRAVSHPVVTEVVAALTGEDGEQASQLLLQLRAKMVLADLARSITPEVANHVLAAYGDEQASWPKASIAALIALIRECHASDEQLMVQLAQVPEIEGYCMAVAVVMEDTHPERGRQGRHLMRHLAGLATPEECEVAHRDYKQD